MAADRLRFLLDQGFSLPKLPVEELQSNVEYEHLSSFAPELSSASTPDWMLYLVAEAGGFDGVVTKDLRQIEQPEELIALTRLQLSVVTWRSAMDDPVTAWALIVAYMPEIRKAMASNGHSIFLLPSPRLITRDSVVKASDRARALSKSAWGTSYPEQTAASLEIMRAELSQRARPDLSALLDRPEIRTKRSAAKAAETPRKGTVDRKESEPLFP
jgi:hypothetical protein